MCINREILSLHMCSLDMRIMYVLCFGCYLLQVCALDVGIDGTVISGSWDKYHCPIMWS